MGYDFRWADPLAGNLTIAGRLTLDTSSGPFYYSLYLLLIYIMRDRTSRIRPEKKLPYTMKKEGGISKTRPEEPALNKPPGFTTFPEKQKTFLANATTYL